MPGCFLTSDGEVEGPLEYVAKMMQEFPFLKKQRGERKWPLCEDISKAKMVATWLNKYKGQQPHEAAKAWTSELESFPLWFYLAAV